MHASATTLADQLALTSLADSLPEIFNQFRSAVEQLPSGIESVRQALTSATVQTQSYAGLPLVGNVTEVLRRFRSLHSSVEDKLLDLYHVCCYCNPSGLALR